MNATQFQFAETNSPYKGKDDVSDWGQEPSLHVTVVFTNGEGTRAALRAAAALAKNLGWQIVLVVPQVVPFHFPLERPPVSIAFLERRWVAFVKESGVQAERVEIEIYLCRDRKQCLRKILPPRSLVVLGGGTGWRSRKEHELERFLRSLCHQVVFIDVNARTQFKSYLRSSCSWLRSLLKLGPRRLMEKLELKGIER